MSAQSAKTSTSKALDHTTNIALAVGTATFIVGGVFLIYAFVMHLLGDYASVGQFDSVLDISLFSALAFGFAAVAILSAVVYLGDKRARGKAGN